MDVAFWFWFLFGTAVSFFILWIVIRSAVLSALDKHAEKSAHATGRSAGFNQYVQPEAVPTPPRATPSPRREARPTGQLWTPEPAVAQPELEGGPPTGVWTPDGR